jgi:hypothetical protein
LNFGNRLMAEFCNTQAMELLPQVLSSFLSFSFIVPVLGQNTLAENPCLSSCTRQRSFGASLGNFFSFLESGMPIVCTPVDYFLSCMYSIYIFLRTYLPVMFYRSTLPGIVKHTVVWLQGR